MIRAPSGISPPREPIRVAGAVPALVAGADELAAPPRVGRGREDPLADQRVPLHECPLVAGERARLAAGSRRGSRACRRRAARPPGGFSTARRRRHGACGDGLCKVGHVREWCASASPCRERAQQHVGGLLDGDARCRCLWRYMRSSAMLQRVREPARLRGHQHRAVRAADGEAFAFLGQRCRRLVRRSLRARRSRRGQDAELVAAEPVGGPSPSIAAPSGPRRGQQRVARGVAERVVVRLEAVQVEDHERGRRGRPPSARSASATKRLRLPSPVSASVIASSRLAASRCTRSRNVSTARTITAAIVAEESATASGVDADEVVVDEER